jgi:hypothetical protein
VQRDLQEQLERRAQQELRELQELFLEEARRYSVLPLDDRRVERFNAAFAGRPQLITGNTQLLYSGGWMGSNGYYYVEYLKQPR